MKPQMQLLLALILLSLTATVHAQSSAFTYQCRFTDQAAPANGIYDLRFSLFGVSSGGSALTSAIDADDVIVSNGLFTATLDFGAGAFDGNARWLEIAVRAGASTGAYTNLAPRQAVNATPYAVRAANFSGAVADNQLSGNIARLNAVAAFTGPVSFGNATGTFNGSFAGNGTGVTNVNLLTANSAGAITWSAQNARNFVLASSPSVDAFPISVTAADVNGDGKMDLISANSSANTLSVLANDGSGGFAIISSPAVGTTPVSVAAADMNGDGKVDLISANSQDNTLSVLTNNGSGGFTLAASPAVGSGPSAVVAVDVNGDGKVDLISANAFMATLSVLTNNGSGGFVLASSPATGPIPVSLVAAHVNGDGKMDMISANQQDNTLSVLTNDGSGRFVLASSPAVGSSPSSVVAADVNGDGKVDLISADSAANTLSVWTNNGSGIFELSSSPLVGLGPSSVTAADVNGDGKLDLISANLSAGTLSILTNGGGGNYALHSSPAVVSPWSVTSADVNGDGRTDLISANGGANTLTVLLDVPTFTANFLGNGAGLTGLSLNNITIGTLPDARLSANVALLNASQTVAGANQFNNPDNTFTGNGSGLTGLNAANLSGSVPRASLTSVPAGSLTGTIDDARLSANVALLNSSQTFTGAKTFNNAANSFVGNGSGLSSLSANNLTSGSVADARLSANVVLLNRNGQTFTGNNSFSDVAISPPAALSFGATTRQMFNLYSAAYGIGVQNYRLYFRTDGGGGGFSWFAGGVHNDATDDPGAGGTRIMTLDGNGELHVGGGVFAGLSLQNRETTNYVGGPANGERWVWYVSQRACRLWSGSDKMTINTNGVVTATAFNPTSDRNAKENFQPVNSREVLDKVAALPISRWNFKQDASSEHIGPMAQDFHAAFGVGTDDKHIATVDADGVALAAIQGLNQVVKEKEAEINALKKRLANLEQLVYSLNQQQTRGDK